MIELRHPLAGRSRQRRLRSPAGIGRAARSRGAGESRSGASALLGEAFARRPIVVGAVVAVAVLVAVAVVIALQQYDDARQRALKDAHSRTVVAASAFDIYFRGALATLSAMAAAPPLVDGDVPAADRYLRSLGRQFTGGLGWLDLQGRGRGGFAAGRPGGRPATPSTTRAGFADRSYFKAVVRTGRPFVSEGLISRASGEPIFAMAVPTRDRRGRLTGVLVGSIEVRSVRDQRGLVQLGYEGLEVVDRSGHLLLTGLGPVANRLLLERMRSGKTGVVPDTAGMEGAGGHAVVYARATVPDWIVAIDRSRASLFAVPRRSLVFDLVAIGGAAVVVLLLLGWAVRRARAHEQAERQRALREREEWQMLQHGLLPDVLPAVDGVVLAGHYRAGGDGIEIGGDWYDAVPRPDGTVLLSVGDVVGHGVAAAVLMGRLRNAFRAYALDGHGPCETMERLRRHLRSGDMATAVCIEIDPCGRTISYSSAGHPPALVAGGETLELSGAAVPPLSVSTPGPCLQATVPLPPEGLILLYTDGLVERRRVDLLERIRLLERTLLDAARAGAGPAAALDTVLDTLLERRRPDDDVALLLAAVTPVPERIEIVVPAEPAQLAPLRIRLRSWLEAHGLPPARIADAVTAVGEALNNAVEHGSPQPGATVALHAAVDRRDHRLVFSVRDGGAWRRERTSPERGRGLLLMRSLMDEVEIERSANGTVATLVASLGG